MINILIVEDEIPARDSLKSDVISILNEDVNICVAGNGVEALQLVNTFQPDILLTDIRMPHMLGTELAGKIVDTFPKCKVIFLSGYSDKDFFKSAIKLGAIDYIEKPVDSDDLKTALNKAVLSVKALNEHNISPDADILRKAFKNKEITSTLMPKNAHFAAVILSPYGEYFSSIPEMIKTYAKKCDLGALSYKKNNGVVESVLFSQDSYIKAKMQSFFSRLFHELPETEQFKCAIGSIEDNSQNVYKSYQNAVCMTDVAFFYPTNTVLYFDENKIQNRPSENECDNIAKEVYTKLLDDDVNAAISKANLLYETLHNTQLLSSAAKKIYYNLFQSITDYYENCFNLSSTENIINYNNSNAFEAQLLSDLHAYLLTLINVSKSLLPVPKGNITDLAIFFLEQHYSNPDLSIGDIVHFCKANSTQLCNTFKQQTGHTINHYLTQIRINAAKKLLVESDYKINEISDMCGFNDSKYFCKVFKKHTSLQPSEYKKKNKKI